MRDTVRLIMPANIRLRRTALRASAEPDHYVPLDITEACMQKLAYAIAGAMIASSVFIAAGWRVSPISTAKASPNSSCPWPASLDAVTAAPKNHRVLLENEHVRVLDVTVQPGEREQLHAHCLPSVMYLMHEGIYKDYGPNGELVSEAKVGAPADQFPMTLWLDPQAPHAVENLDAKPVHLIRVELKNAVQAGT